MPVMTLTCACGNVYGRWRNRCPACGTAIPEDKIQREEKKLAPPVPREPREKKNPCILCRRRVKGKRIKGTLTRTAPNRCPHCDEIVHRECFSLHEVACRQFQRERLAEIERLK